MRRKQLDFVSTGDGDETGKLGVNLHAVNAGSRALAGELAWCPPDDATELEAVSTARRMGRRQEMRTAHYGYAVGITIAPAGR